MDARVAEFMQMMGMADTHRDLFRKIVATHKDTPEFQKANHSTDTLNRLIDEGAQAMVKAYGELMEEKFEPKYLDELLRYAKTEAGHHIVWGMYLIQINIGERAMKIGQDFKTKLLMPQGKR